MDWALTCTKRYKGQNSKKVKRWKREKKLCPLFLFIMRGRRELQYLSRCYMTREVEDFRQISR